VLNLRGYERAVACGIREINCVVVATDSFGLRNQGADIETTMKTAARIAARTQQDRIEAAVTVSTAFGCPFEGEVPHERVVQLVARLRDMGFKEAALADTIGAAGPSDVSALLRAVRRESGDMRLRCHFHNTRNTGVANAYAAVLEGVRTLDTSCGGLGGCPFAPNATGNVATEDVLYMLQRMGVETGVDIRRIMETARWLGARLDTQMPAMVTRAGLFPPEPAENV
jgi:hydroxymethylglutaryl-CoA lyase